MMARFFNNHSEYEGLLMEHLDGRLDAPGEAKLRAHLETCAACAADAREMGALQTTLRSQPMVEPPRSFALPLTTPHPSRVSQGRSAQPALPGFLRWAGSGSVAILRSMQIATAAAALVLMALVGLDMTGVTRTQEPQYGIAMYPASEDQVQQLRVAEEGDIGILTLDDPPSDAPAPAQDPAAVEDPEAAEDTEAARPLPPAATPAPEPMLVEFIPIDQGRSALEWAKLALSGVTALLAMGVAGLSWAMYRRPS